MGSTTFLTKMASDRVDQICNFERLLFWTRLTKSINMMLFVFVLKVTKQYLIVWNILFDENGIYNTCYIPNSTSTDWNSKIDIAYGSL